MKEKITGTKDLSSCTYYLMENEHDHWMGNTTNIIEAMQDTDHIYCQAMRADLVLKHMTEHLQPGQEVLYDEYSAQQEEGTPTHYDLMEALYHAYKDNSGLDIDGLHSDCTEGDEVYLKTYDEWKIYLHADESELLIKATYKKRSLVLGMDSEERLEESVSAMETFINEYEENSFKMLED